VIVSKQRLKVQSDDLGDFHLHCHERWRVELTVFSIEERDESFDPPSLLHFYFHVHTDALASLSYFFDSAKTPIFRDIFNAFKIEWL
jgi:hypothetical protein